MRNLIVLLFLICDASYYARADEGVSLTCVVGNSHESIDVHHRLGEGRFQSQFKAGNNQVTVVVTDVYSPNPTEDYIVLSDGKHAFTQPLYCSRR